MSNLYQPPFISGAIGDTLTFTLTGTSTPQNIYTTPALDTAWPNPIEADAEGNFPPIFLDPSLNDYRVDYKDIDGVSYPGYPVDNVPASQDQSNAFLVKGASPIIEEFETDATTDNKRWRSIVQSEVKSFQTGTDAGSWSTYQTVSRAGVVAFPKLSAAAGSFAATITGYASPLSATVYYNIIDDFVRMWLKTQAAGTSDSTAMTITGMPPALYPADTSHCAGFRVIDNGAHAYGVAAISGLGVITVLNNGGNFTASGSKGLPRGWSIGYPL